MAINRVDYPANLTDQADFSAHGELIETRFLDQSYAPQFVVAGEIPQGVVLQIGGVVYRADSDTAITGTTSDYVRIVPDGATATAEYVADLSGVTWNTQYNGYYDTSGNLYVFDEGVALAAGDISSVFGRYLAQQSNGDVHVGNTLHVSGDVDIEGTLEFGGLRPTIIASGGETIDPDEWWQVPQGIYQVIWMSSDGDLKLFQYTRIGLSWYWRGQHGPTFPAGMVISDGENARLWNVGSVASSIHWKKYG